MPNLYNRRQFLALLSSSAIAAASCQSSRQTSSKVKNKSPQAQLNPLHFVVVGDVGRGNRGQYAVARAMRNHYQDVSFPLVLLTGDNIYENGEIKKLKKVFERPYKYLLSRGVRFRAVLGNHDIRERNGDAQVEYPAFNMAGRYYNFRQGNIEFFALDTNENAIWEDQIPWLEAALAQSDAPWKIVFGHHPIYSSGKHGNNPGLQKALCPLFKQYAVQLYCCGHDHHYERSHPIEGTTYLVAGGGSKTRPVGQSSWTAHAQDVLSFASIAVENNLDKSQLIITGIDARNNVIDRGVIALEA